MSYEPPNFELVPISDKEKESTHVSEDNQNGGTTRELVDNGVVVDFLWHLPAEPHRNVRGPSGDVVETVRDVFVDREILIVISERCLTDE